MKFLIKSLPKKRGFTLIEILVSLIILAGATMIISRIWFGNHQRVNKIADYHKVVQLMEKKIVELEMEWKRQTFASIPEENKGNFSEEKYYSWSVKTQALRLPDPKASLNLEEQQEMAGAVADITVEYLSQAVLEAKLTIYYQKGDFKSAYSITTYIVDNEKEIQVSLPGGGL